MQQGMRVSGFRLRFEISRMTDPARRATHILRIRECEASNWHLEIMQRGIPKTHRVERLTNWSDQPTIADAPVCFHHAVANIGPAGFLLPDP